MAKLKSAIKTSTLGYTAAAILICFFNFFVVYVGLFVVYQRMLPTNDSFSEQNVAIVDDLNILTSNEKASLTGKAVELGQRLNMEWVGIYLIDDSGCTSTTSDSYCDQVMEDFNLAQMRKALGVSTQTEADRHNAVIFTFDKTGTYTLITSSGHEALRHFSAARKDAIFEHGRAAAPATDQYTRNLKYLEKAISYVYGLERVDLGVPFFLFMASMVIVWLVVGLVKKRYWGVTTAGELQKERGNNLSKKLQVNEFSVSEEKLLSKTKRKVYSPPASSYSGGGFSGGGGGGFGGGGGGGGHSSGGGRG